MDVPPKPRSVGEEQVASNQPALGTWRTIALPGVDGSDTEAAWTIHKVSSDLPPYEFLP